MYKISNDKISVVVSSMGAELKSVKYLDEEILWSGEELWSKQSPVLFPFIGSLKEKSFEYNSVKYSMPTHGFIKDTNFEVFYHDELSIIFKTSYNVETLKMYPFKFELYAEYNILDTDLNVTFKVRNVDSNKMYYGLGFHPGFLYNKDISELYMPNITTDEVYFDPKFVYKIEKSNIGSIKMSDFSHELIDKQTICYKDLNTVVLNNKNYSITIESNSIYTAFWQQRPEDPKFICIESWNGMVDYLDSYSDIELKPSLLSLNPNEVDSLNIKFILNESYF